MAQDKATQEAIVHRMIDAGESESNIATVIQHFKSQATEPSAPKQPAFNPPRGFFSAAKDIVTGIPGIVGSALEDTARQIVPNNPVLTQRNMQRQSQSAQDFGKGVEAHGLPAEVVHSVGQAVGVPSHDIVQDYNDKNYSALAGDIVAPVAMAEGIRAGVDALPAVKAAIDKRSALKASGKVDLANANQLSGIIKAIPPTNAAKYGVDTIKRAQPYLEAEHAAAPIDSVQSFLDATNSAVTQIEAHIGDFIQANPSDLIRTDPLRAVKNALARNPRGGAMERGLRSIADLNLDQPLTVGQADKIRLQLNAENQAVLEKNNYDIETARKADPSFAAREAASNALRTGVYDQLEDRGISGVRELRLDEGALMQLRNAAQRQVFSGSKLVAGTGANSMGRRIAAQGVKLGSAGAGAGVGGVVGGPVGAVSGATVGAIVGDDLSRRISRPNMSRDALIAKAFEKPTGTQSPSYPSVPNAPVIRGQLTSGARPMGASPDTSYVRSSTGAPLQPKIRGFIEPPARAMGPKPDTSSVRAEPAKAVIRKNPKTGRYERIYTSEVIR